MDADRRDQKLVNLFAQWLAAFEEVMTHEEEGVHARKVLADIESQIAATPAEGLRGLVVKFGLHHFLSDQADCASIHAESAYRDLVRLAGHDPAAEISLLLAKGDAARTRSG